jgi:hypothetical protein
MAYDPNSPDAMFAKILQKLEQQNEHAYQTHNEYLEIFSELRKDIIDLKTWKSNMEGRSAMIALLISASTGVITWLVTRKSG